MLKKMLGSTRLSSDRLGLWEYQCVSEASELFQKKNEMTQLKELKEEREQLKPRVNLARQSTWGR